MIANREQIHVALYEMLQAAIVGVKTWSRRLEGWDKYSGIEQPTISVVKGGEVVMRQTGIPAHYAMDFFVWIYVRHADKSVDPSSLLTAFYDQIEAALTPAPGLPENRQTLGGMVHDCRVEGTIETDEGMLGDQAVAKVPIKILTT
jgi:hypothetical protein